MKVSIAAAAAVAAMLIALIDLISIPTGAEAAPALQLPWPTSEQHRINGGYTYGCGTHTGSNHYAIDFSFTIGQNVAATATGTVTIAATGYNGGAGNYVAVDHGGGFVSRYLHLRATSPFAPGVSAGAVVTQGQLIGYSGDTGGVGPHLHFDLKLNGGAHKAEPMSNVPQAGQPGFGWYGYSVQNGVGCGSNQNDPSPYWTSQPPDKQTDFNGDGKDDTITFNDEGQGTVVLSTGSSFEGIFQGQVFEWGEIPGVGDFNGDGYDDVISFSQAGRGVVTLNTTNDGFGSLGDWGAVFTWGEIPGGFQPFAYEVIFDPWFDNADNPPLWYP